MPFLTDIYGVSNLDGHNKFLLERGIKTDTAEFLMLGDTDGYLSVSKDDGTTRLKGTATVWKDMIADLFGKRLLSNQGKLDYDYDENAMKFQSGGLITKANDRIGANLEINHEFKKGISITFKPHFHWFQEEDKAFELTLRYRLQRNGHAKTENWTTITTTVNATNNVWEYISGTLNQITSFPDLLFDCDISDTIQFQLARTDSLGSDMRIYFLDIHGEVDSFGSDEVISKI